jgi:DNA replication regulator SLD3
VKSSTSSAVTSRPGAVTKRPVPSKVRRSLQRVLTDERHKRSGSRGPSGAISLMRSATAPVVPGLKRESSESPLLESIPSAQSQSLAVSRGGVLKTKKFSQREVDLSNLGPGNDTKSKKPNLEAELKEAILALKRPNRQLAGQLMVETAERRTASASINSKSELDSKRVFLSCIFTLTFTESKKPIRNPSFQGVQILSTPKGNRHKEVTPNTPPIPRLNVGQSDMEAIPPSSLPRIPLSVTRSANAGSHEAAPRYQATPARTGHGAKPGAVIQVTPCRGRPTLTSRLSNNLTALSPHGYDGVGLESPSQVRQSNKTQPHDLPVPSLQAIECTPGKRFTFQGTPIKVTNSLVPDERTSSILLTQNSQATGIENAERKDDSDAGGNRGASSIYKTLGWDDYDDLA